MNIIFLGGIFTHSIEPLVTVLSNGPLQIAADTLQKNYIRGLVKQNCISHIDIINLPFIGSYPNFFKKLNFTPPKKIEKFEKFEKVQIHNHSFNNFKGFKNFSRLITLLLSLKNIKAKQSDAIICYSMHLPFLLSCYLYKLCNKKVKFYVIIPDLPEYMSNKSGITKLFSNTINKLSYFITNRSNGVVFITEQMKNKFKKNLPYTVIEGISDEQNNINYLKDQPININKNFFLYTGTLDKRYGIKDLITAYIAADISDIALVICGEGNQKKFVTTAALQNPNIIYLGQLDRTSILSLQKQALLLINPRPHSDFTSFSFPSKIIEYMASGTPVLMYKLHGIPDKYSGYYYEINSYHDFITKLKIISNLSPIELHNTGEKALNFIQKHTNSDQQVKKLVQLITQ
ncbi:hypothetical protein B9T10_05805 [Wohlfahrtiimonas chitiniclastica]|uniref:glycosyltransferase n=1 Tax=Wohlfahrtiimonas chitiniclastica TaxID=400946 RepID=UPI000B980C2B|nr:glycosyltransferase [Wohlfahrtiimonas chitiniclastica]OYQ70485.1 hypothetical protein B9T13_04295 [Wohlfahrtiimonas chitiniclastica]OYQ88805.1 hypothetical protein B9T10_05805 [Wohlfahrtiimonas chitiniclastica]